MLRLQSSCHVFTHICLQVLLLSVAVDAAARRQNDIAGVVDLWHVDFRAEHAPDRPVQLWEVVWIVVSEPLLGSRKLLNWSLKLLRFLDKILAAFHSALQEIECFIASVGLFVKDLSGFLSLFILIDGCEIDVWVRSFELLNLTIESILFERRTHEAKLLISLR